MTLLDDFIIGKDYCSTGAIEVAVIFNIVLGTIIYLLSKITKQYSWVDRIWTILPIVYAIHFIYHPLQCNQDGELPIRKLIITLLIISWGSRLTFNFWRKGGYKKGGEDHRWPYIRRKWGGFRIQLLLFFFISYYQLFLILWFTLPVYYVSSKNLAALDYLFVFVGIAFLLLEKTADDEQYEYQTKKRIELANNQIKQPPKTYKAGFITSGLFRFSRHPNFFAQISFWWVIALFSVFDVGSNISILGAVQLTLLFQGSTRLTQEITSLKYPLYSTYQKNVPMLIPQLFPPVDVLHHKSQ